MGSSESDTWILKNVVKAAHLSYRTPRVKLSCFSLASLASQNLFLMMPILNFVFDLYTVRMFDGQVSFP